jgi:putative toxin-antitoxin system antitoxin component (TIGR02293 family)
MIAVTHAAEEALLKVARLLWLTKQLPRLESPHAVHELMLQGLPWSSLKILVEKFHCVPRAELLKALGVSERTLQRHKKQTSKPLSPEQSGRAWKVAEILARATEVFGSQEQAERWLEQPAIGLDGERPIDLLETIPGAETIKKYLGRLEHGVYT